MPREVEELANFLVRLARIRQDPPTLADGVRTAPYARMPDRVLVSKGAAAERLGVSVRTIERLAATGRLRQVHVEARFRVSDLEVYLNSLAENAAPGSGIPGDGHRVRGLTAATTGDAAGPHLLPDEVSSTPAGCGR